MKALLAVPVVTALALLGCGLHHDRDVGRTTTTGAAIDLRGAADPAASECLTQAPVTRAPAIASDREPATWPEPMEGPGELVVSDDTPAYDRPPLHEPMGSTYGDVGMPYPLPDVPVPAAQGPRAAAGVAAQPAAFFETSFANPAAPAGTAFPETTFGPPAPASTAFPETTFAGDGGA